MQITSLDYNAFQGRIAIGRILEVILKENTDYIIFRKDGSQKK